MQTQTVAHSSLLCKERYRLIHATTFRTNVPLTALANISQFQLQLIQAQLS